MNAVLGHSVDESAPDKPDIGTVIIRGNSILSLCGVYTAAPAPAAPAATAAPRGPAACGRHG